MTKHVRVVFDTNIVLGKADYLATYDAHFAPLNGEFQGIKIVKALSLLWSIRGAHLSDDSVTP
ncbi:MAG: hypothetical protein M3Q45_12900 [Chloroflexota bacterium]|nr:hypothetical protein [Chloroflexota bacterium]